MLLLWRQPDWQHYDYSVGKQEAHTIATRIIILPDECEAPEKVVASVRDSFQNLRLSSTHWLPSITPCRNRIVSLFVAKCRKLTSHATAWMRVSACMRACARVCGVCGVVCVLVRLYACVCCGTCVCVLWYVCVCACVFVRVCGVVVCVCGVVCVWCGVMCVCGGGRCARARACVKVKRTSPCAKAWLTQLIIWSEKGPALIMYTYAH